MNTRTKQILVTLVFALACGLIALAQSQPGDPQSMPQGTSPATQPSAQPQTPTQSPDIATSDRPNTTVGEKKLKGCIESEGGKFVLEESKSKEVALTGSQDFSSHVGHTVVVHGNYGAASNSGTETAATSGNAGEQFMVSKIDMVSDTCKDKDKDKGSKNDTNKDQSKPSPYHQ